MANSKTILFPKASASPSSERQHHKGRKPFSAFMKRLANLKTSSSSNNSTSSASASRFNGGRAASYSAGSSSKPSKFNDPYPPPSTSSSAAPPSHLSLTSHRHSTPSISTARSFGSVRSDDADDSPTLAPSINAPSARPAPSNTTATTSAFSSPTHSVRSLTTTLTTITSIAPGSMLNANYNPHPSHHHNPYAAPVLFQHQFPTTPGPNGQSSPNPHGMLHPASYNTVTANNLLTDNASIITLASSSKRGRRRSFDTDASVRALAPSSIWGGSRESLPLSILSANLDSGGGGRSIAGERASIYGSPSLTRGDAGSMRDFGTGSIMGEISGSGGPGGSGTPMMNATGLSGRESFQIGVSRRSSGWGELLSKGEEDIDDDDETERKSLSDRSASSKGEDEDQDQDAGDRGSIMDGSSNVGLWHGVPGKGDERDDESRQQQFLKVN
ncbi:hypothetical protein RUND412_004147 [Rhizina undulata]